ncbi:septum site-determining protein MinC [Kingella kingae]|uniref:septum site-determining protein MinC n=1 Tax=Kingella kingae TaxID=504 RepID=UPI0025509AA1|nr:septum site-determining protein MinC [Kingella kingae]MDK4543974.1 septum site-determining protein MinC [Kingella kingae]MDK4565796.1 septum site-determining protein MinC [Kingella kingae]MDK4578752.1 septum site-determining protein MinC [Kingella kingae]MDK4591033.1 septum site-determining protein MinC [Kingella kingae]MDK4608630.1 septum site-determining protein MinC [Kingella kingae]
MERVFEVKSSRLEAFSLCLQSDDLTQIEQYLQQKQEKYQSLAALPFVLDLGNGDWENLDLAAVLALFAKQGLCVVALRHASGDWADKAKTAGLCFVHQAEKQPASGDLSHADNEANDAAQDTTSTENENEADTENVQAASDLENTENEVAQNNEAEPEPAPELELTARPTVVVTTPVRTGQQVYAKQADLIVLGMVSEGAEIIADGNIHVYAPMRGRALAGESGDKSARIFMQSMQAELVSIAGIYRVFEQDLPDHLHKQAVKIELQDDDRLSVAAIVAK